MVWSPERMRIRIIPCRWKELSLPTLNRTGWGTGRDGCAMHVVDEGEEKGSLHLCFADRIPFSALLCPSARPGLGLPCGRLCV